MSKWGIPIYLVSLVRDGARRAELERRFPSSFPRFIWIRAVDGPALTAAEFFRSTASSRLRMTPGEVGCSLSHIDVLQNFLDSGESCALVLEDDVLGDDRKIEFLLGLADTLADGEVMLCGGQEGLRSRRWLIGRPVSSETAHTVYRIPACSQRQLWRTCCYLITRAAAVAILKAQRESLKRADQWSNFGVKRFLYVDMLSHPLEVSMSSIEAERRTIQAIGPATYRGLLMDRVGLYWSLFVSGLLVIFGYCKVFGSSRG